MLNQVLSEWLFHAGLLREVRIRKGFVIQERGVDLLQTLYRNGDTCQIESQS